MPDAPEPATTLVAILGAGVMGETLLSEIASELRPGQLVISLAAGITTATIESRLPDGVAVVRVMPNTPALVDEGMAAISRGSHSGEHPTVLRERVTSPGGTTAAAVRELEDHKVRAAFMVALESARDRSRALAR